jgi:hypothetical protein
MAASPIKSSSSNFTRLLIDIAWEKFSANLFSDGF